MKETTKLSLAVALLALGVPACATSVGGESEPETQQQAPRMASVEELRTISNVLLERLKADPELRARFVREPEAVLADLGIDQKQIDDVASAFARIQPDCRATCESTCGNTCGKTCGYTCSETNGTCNKTCVNTSKLT